MFDNIQERVIKVWGDDYSPSFNQARALLRHLDTVHSFLHLSKAQAKLAAALEPVDHGSTFEPAKLEPGLADLLISAVRIAHLNGISLDTIVSQRLDALEAGRTLNVATNDAPTGHSVAK